MIPKKTSTSPPRSLTQDAAFDKTLTTGQSQMQSKNSEKIIKKVPAFSDDDDDDFVDFTSFSKKIEVKNKLFLLLFCLSSLAI